MGQASADGVWEPFVGCSWLCHLIVIFSYSADSFQPMFLSLFAPMSCFDTAICCVMIRRAQKLFTHWFRRQIRVQALPLRHHFKVMWSHLLDAEVMADTAVRVALRISRGRLELRTPTNAPITQEYIVYVL